MSNEFCGKCGAHWDEHEMGVPAPYCPRPSLKTPEARAIQQEENAIMARLAMDRLKKMLAAAQTEQNALDVADAEIERLKSIISTVHSWIVCAAITTPEDMMQHSYWISHITGSEYTGDGKDDEDQIYT